MWGEPPHERKLSSPVTNNDAGIKVLVARQSPVAIAMAAWQRLCVETRRSLAKMPSNSATNSHQK